ncbi:hypothetical protein N9L66_00455 [Porticoccaceae bacterium]|nr:hypothetical protein [Porticoccaceae bacterium]MDA8682055.1 hypothetical protein [Porticoccaceae bacterium]MDB2343072.1 hypothetical protein [Porticoccaceae bacterium]MDB2486775.1 hypothetical protein [Porticoccaceae bacterium]MDB2664412.1 hypothetical protein [Porticoccaceae bacterium]
MTSDGHDQSTDAPRNDIKGNRFSRQLKALNLSPKSVVFLVSISVLSMAFVIFALTGGHSASSGGTEPSSGPEASEVITTQPSVSVAALSSDAPDDVLQANEKVSEEVRRKVESNRAKSGEGSRIMTTTVGSEAEVEGQASLYGLEEILKFEPAPDDAVAESFFEEVIETAQQAPQTSMTRSSRAAAVDHERAEAERMKALESTVTLLARPPTPVTYVRKSVKTSETNRDNLKGGNRPSSRPNNENGLESLALAPTEPRQGKRVATGLYTQVYAVNIHALNSDISGSTVLEVISEGPLKGARLNASYERVEWTDMIRLRASSMTLKSGEVVQVNAIILDAQTSLAAISGEVDNHYLFRYGWWGVGSTLSSLGKGVEAYSSTTTLSSSGIITSGSDLNATEKAVVAAGSIGSDIGEVMQKNLNRPPTITLEPYQELGVFFIDDVLITGAL